MPNSTNIFIVDDDPQIVALLSDILSDCADKITTAPDGASAFSLIKSSHPSVIISDYNMPGLNGIELLRFLNDENIKVPVIWLTGMVDLRVFREGWQAGAYDIFQKPVKFEILKECLIGALSGGKEYLANRVPNFLHKAQYKVLNLPLLKENYEFAMNSALSQGISISTLINKLLDAEREIKSGRKK